MRWVGIMDARSTHACTHATNVWADFFFSVKSDDPQKIGKNLSFPKLRAQNDQFEFPSAPYVYFCSAFCTQNNSI